MGVAIYIAPERKIPGFNHMVNGKAIGQVPVTDLTAICRKVKQPSLFDFVSHDPDELADLWKGGFGEAPDDLPDEEWFDASLGLDLVRDLLGYLRDKPEALENSAAIIEDLQEYEAVLSRLEAEEVAFHFAIDF